MPAKSSQLVKNAAPFLKWAGGKSFLLKQYAPFFPPEEQFGRYYEPFIGSAAVFFFLQPHDALLADANEQLIETYKVVQQDVEALIKALKEHRNVEEYFYQVRSQRPDQLTPVQRAARIIYLNKTCYNGLYRENRKGEFNVPFGRYSNPTICNQDRLRAASLALQNAELLVADFERAVDSAGAGDLVYFDPPYVPLNATSNFTSYNSHGFSDDDHRRLAKTFHRLAAEGCNVMLSNSYAPLVFELYRCRGYQIVEIKARRSINSKPDKRGPIPELLITNLIA